MSIHAIVMAERHALQDRHRRGARRVAYLHTYTRDPREVVRVGTCKLALFMIHMPTGVVGACRRRAVAGSVRTLGLYSLTYSTRSASGEVECYLHICNYRMPLAGSAGLVLYHTRCIRPEERRVGSWRSDKALSLQLGLCAGIR